MAKREKRRTAKTIHHHHLGSYMHILCAHTDGGSFLFSSRDITISPHFDVFNVAANVLVSSVVGREHALWMYRLVPFNDIPCKEAIKCQANTPLMIAHRKASPSTNARINLSS
ncbi:hypothetical protein DMN91_000458 [Ooceraea biroi]|uniref:Uncharacterized protein n=1 Tax=Ooceraea biroi TaxID=2015173 RepID=A0A3L8E1Q7_OOCBI|nr:hypothetical protein DMN91_000458 [Ooceraea biroi]